MFTPFPDNMIDTFIQQLQSMLEKHRHTIDTLSLDPNPTYDTLLKVLQDVDEELEVLFTPLSHLNSVMNSERTQQIFEESLPLLSAFQSEVTQNEMLFRRIEQLPSVSGTRGTVLHHTIRDFVLAGARLTKENKRRMKNIDLRLSELNNLFSRNLLNATKKWEMILSDPRDVAELPAHDLDAAKIEKEGKTWYRFSLQMPSYLAYMTYGSNRARREEIYRAYHTRAPDNADVIDELLQLRHEKAQILGYANYADYALQTRDAKDETAVLSFLDALTDAAMPQAKKELETLKAFALTSDGLDDLAPWDIAYYGEKLKKEMFDLDAAHVKPYFEQSRVVDGLLTLVSELFSITFRPVSVPVWHTCVSVFDLYESEKCIGRIYFDLEARPEKRGGAWMHNWESYHKDSHHRLHYPSAFIVANFAPASDSHPSLLRHDDVVTLFHEMGHALHHLLGRVEERSLSGINGVAWDVVEFPSQFLENFAYEAPVLRRFAVHYHTHEPIPDTMVTQIKRAKNFLAALGMLRQIEFSLFDFQLHQHRYQGKQIQELLELIREKTSLLPSPKFLRFQHGFSHIFAGGYAAGYYSYKWAEVLSADAFFACVSEEGNFIPQKAREYRRHILARGSSRPMHQLFHDWLKRDPDIHSLLKLYGIGEPGSK